MEPKSRHSLKIPDFLTLTLQFAHSAGFICQVEVVGVQAPDTTQDFN